MLFKVFYFQKINILSFMSFFYTLYLSTYNVQLYMFFFKSVVPKKKVKINRENNILYFMFDKIIQIYTASEKIEYQLF